ncbi:MAG: ClbS/DfsB family four-helix bundle protein [Bacteroidia bacterium]|nr:ClbS/DfsB family four-helix bundle protein [Bacteroidia bacterium]
MPIPTSKTELAQAIQENYIRLKTELEIIDENKSRLQQLEGHAKNTKMSVCDLLAYLIGWGQLVLKWNHLKQSGAEVDFPETGYKWNQLGELASKFYKDYEKHSFANLQQELDKTVEAILKLVDSKTNQQLYKQLWYEKYTLGRMIQLNTSSPFQNARLRIRKWKKESAKK